MVISVTRSVLDNEQALWRLYQVAFAPAEEVCIQDQLCYSEASFRDALADEEIVKLVILADDRPVGLALATFNLEKARIAYVNPVRLERAYPDRRILYFTCLAVHPDFQKRDGIFHALVKELTVFADQQRAIVAFDFSTEKNAGLPDMLVRVARKTQQDGLTATKAAEYRALGGQEYGVIELT